MQKGGRRTNKEFKGSFVELASNKPKKGHLTNQSRRSDDNQIVEGILKHVIIDRIDTDGWMVQVGTGRDSSVYACTNPQWTVTLPESTTTETMYVPKKKTEVEFSLDKHSKIYTITRVKGSSQFMSGYQDKLKISLNENTKTNSDINARIEMTANAIKLGADNIVIQDKDQEINLIQAQTNTNNQIIILQEQNAQLQQKIDDQAASFLQAQAGSDGQIASLQEQNTQLQQRIEDIENLLNKEESDQGED